MRPLPETRSRRLGDNQHQKVAKIKRLINGLSTTHQVTTRSQAKVTKKAKSIKKHTPVRSAAARKVLNGTTIGGSSRVNGLLQRRSSGPFSVRGSKDNNKKGAKLTNGLGRSSRQLVILGNHLNNGSFRSGEKEAQDEKASRLAIQRADAAEKRAERLKKRRSSLWVLNCEAESFLFGETAADKHEVELPPVSTPPKKRRRMRTNELGTLLKESPILSSKLRSPPLSAVKAEQSTSDKTACDLDRVPPVSEAEVAKLKEDEDVQEKRRCDPVKVSSVKDELANVGSLPSYRSNLLLHSPFKSISECNLNPESVRLENILSSMDWRFSFEERPSDEAWYSTFERQENRQSSVPAVPTASGNSWAPPLLLPYESKVFNISKSPKKKLSRLPRKSPRCHASTLAILSSLKRGRYRNSLLGPLSPGLPSNGLLVQAAAAAGSLASATEASTKSTEEKPKRTYKRRNVLPPLRSPALDLGTPSPQKTSTLPPVSPPLLTLCSPTSFLSSSPGSPSSPQQRMKDLSATQYLWDSIQLLSDPYVIQVLAEERGTSPSPPRTNLNHVCSSQVKAESSAVKGVKAGCHRKETNSVVLTSERTRNASGSSTLNSNRHHNHVKITTSSFHHVNGNNNNNNSTEYILSFDNSKKPVSISTSAPSKRNLCKASSASSSISTESSSDNFNELKLNVEISCGEKGGNGISSSNYRSNRKSSRKSPVVLVSDIFKSGTLKVNATTVTIHSQKGVISSSNNNHSSEGSSSSSVAVNCDDNHNTVNSPCKTGSREDLLFRVDGLPPLPAWPV